MLFDDDNFFFYIYGRFSESKRNLLLACKNCLKFQIFLVFFLFVQFQVFPVSRFSGHPDYSFTLMYKQNKLLSIYQVLHSIANCLKSNTFRTT